MRKTYRILKRKEIREQKRLEKMKIEQADYAYDKVFSFQHFVRVYPKCLKGVSWKASVQNYEINAVTKLYNDFLRLRDRKLPTPISDKTISIYERGKERFITPIHVKDRVIQKVVCDYALVPILSRKLIYDNGASLKGKGVQFSRNRVFKHLKNAINEFGTDFYVLTFDFKSYFDSVPHSTCRYILNKYILDKEVVDITMEMIKSHHKKQINKIKDIKERKEKLRQLENDELCGICLGSQVSQIMALIVANDLDHYIKDIRKCKYYYRYMDDGNIFLKTKEELNELLNEMKKICDRLGLKFNDKKTQITKIRKGFTFLKVHYYVTDSGKIIRKLKRQGTIRMRRKLKKLKRKIDNNELTLDNAYDSMQSWIAHSKVANSYKTVQSMLELYDNLFGGYKITKKWKAMHGGKKNVLQADKWAEYRWSGIV